MLTFFWHGISMLVAKEHPKHTLVVYAALTFFTIVVVVPCKSVSYTHLTLPTIYSV